MENIKQRSGKDAATLNRLAEDRKEWRSLANEQTLIMHKAVNGTHDSALGVCANACSMFVGFLVATAAAAPDHYGPPPTRFYGFPGAYSGPVIPILKDEREGPDASGVYSFEFETGNGIKREEQGAPQGPSGAVAMQGGWSFTFPDGSPADVSFVADDAGFRVESDLLPTPPPLPAHAIAQIEKARREDAAAAALSGHYTAPRTSYGYP
ncbi:endocuticle structural glycoprotein SgAbd-2-like [Penaeus indicus]|uniref:endocuticle structural glycoprotein SgAbd-2-like n=1 Tax=Penaeus indicus TaxID=29960 RepID=UPI00300C0FCD